MKYTIKGKHVTVTRAMRDMAKKKLKKFEKFFRPDAEAVVMFKTEKTGIF